MSATRERTQTSTKSNPRNKRRRKKRSATVTPKKEDCTWHKAFIEELTHRGNVSASCKAADVIRQTAYEHRKRHEDFAKLWKAALETACDSLENEAIRRAEQGTSKPVFYKGEICGHIQEYSDILLIFLLKANRPHKFRDNPTMTQGDVPQTIVRSKKPTEIVTREEGKE